MKRWAKILLVIGIVWLVLLVLYSFWSCGKIMADCELSGKCGIAPNCYSPITYFPPILLLGIPSWIMFIVVGVWGRGKK